MSERTHPVLSHGAIFILGVIQGIVLNLRPATLPNAPAKVGPAVPVVGQLVCDDNVLKCGEKIYGDRIEHSFVLRNTGDSPVVIEGIRSDSGVDCLVDVKTISPGKHARVMTRALLRGPEGEFHREITVTTNAIQSPVLRLGLVGTLLSDASIDPKPLLLGAFRASDPPLRNVQVRLRTDHHVTGVRNSPLLGVQLQEGTEAGSYVIQVQPHPQQHLGTFQGWAQIVANEQGHDKVFGTAVHGYSLADPQAFPADRKICQLKVGEPFTINGRSVEGRPIDPFCFGGEPVVVVYWASWDPLSTSVLQALDELSEKEGKGKFRVVGHAVDSSSVPVKEAIEANHLRCPVLFAEPDENGIPLVLKRHKILALPLLVLVDPSGKILEITSSIQPIEQAIASRS